MITAIANATDGTRIVLLGVSRGNIDRLTDGKPIRATAATHPGFPKDLVVGIMFGETDAAITEMLKNYIGDQTKVHVVPGADAAAVQVLGVPIGATGRYPYGQQDATDEGELAAAMAADPKNGVVRIEFGKPVAWLSLPAKAAREFAALLVSKADELEKKMS